MFDLSVSKFVRVAALAAALGTAGLFAMPAMAAPAAAPVPAMPAMSSAHAPASFLAVQYHFRPNHRGPRYCMNNAQVRRSIDRQGYNRVQVFSSRGPIVQARAVRRGALYAIRFDSCRGAIISAVRLHR